VIKDDYIRADGTCAFINILNGKEKASAAHISAPSDFDKKSKE
jgi:hypothetical protein